MTRENFFPPIDALSVASFRRIQYCGMSKQLIDFGFTDVLFRLEKYNIYGCILLVVSRVSHNVPLMKSLARVVRLRFYGVIRARARVDIHILYL